MKKPRTAITPTREENYAEWYQSVLKAADLAEHSDVRGCMVIKPWGYAIWENIQKVLDRKFKETGHKNAYFPLFIPLSYMEKEAKHVEGFAKECAVVTHHRLEQGPDGKLHPAGELEEPLIVRPTSEMIIGHTFAKWVESYRDLPLLINQWANVVRWEMRTRMFLRTTEFLWQEGHTVHASKEEALQETKQMLAVYEEFCHRFLALPVICGEKTESERFPGAVHTYTIEAMTQDRKALQSGTSHFLGQNFSKSCGIQFQTEQGAQEYGWTTSWGVTTRLIGAMIMAHSDDDGLILPPRIAASHIAIIPIIHSEEAKETVVSFCKTLKQQLQSVRYQGEPLQVELDLRDMRSGEKSWGWIKKGIPLRLEVGLREIESGKLMIARRDKPHKELTPFAVEQVANLLEDVQENLFAKAKTFRDQHTLEIQNKEEFYTFFTDHQDQIHGGFALCYWAEDSQIETKLKEELGVTIRCIPLHLPPKEGLCIFTGKKTMQRVIFAKAY